MPKIVGFLHFLNFLGPSEKNYNPQSLMITLYYYKWKLDTKSGFIFYFIQKLLEVKLLEVLFWDVPAAHFNIHQNHKYIVQEEGVMLT